jgi:AcrR family transcriptional regulator
MTTLRERQRVEAMKRVQRAAVSAFAAHGFERVRVEEVAEEAGVSPVSVYRWFGTKEDLVLWDEYDPPLFEAIAARLGDRSPLDAVREGLLGELDRMYDSERALVLDRVRLIYAEPALLAAALSQQSSMVDGLTHLFGEAGVEGSGFDHAVVAATVVGVLTVCLEEWARLDGSVSLGGLVADGFTSLERSLCSS